MDNDQPSIIPKASMMEALWKDYISLIRREVVPALGCTEPTAVALAASLCRDLANEMPVRMHVLVSGNLFKNGMGVGVPGTGMIGLAVAAAVGATGGQSDAGLEVLKGLTDEQVEQAKAILPAVSVDVKAVPESLYAEVIAWTANHEAKVVIADEHTRVRRMELDGRAIKDGDGGPNGAARYTPKSLPNLQIGEVLRFAREVPREEIGFIREAAEMNQALADAGLQGLGLGIGKLLSDQIAKRLLADDLLTLSMRLASAASDARMDGAMLPAMSNSGSGNQGISATMPVVAAVRILGADDEKLCRALIMSHLLALAIKQHQDKLSALCAASTAAMGAGAAITWLLGGSPRQIGYCINNMVGDVTGIICDGAGSACSMKVSTAAAAAVKAALMAVNDLHIPESQGIVADDVDQTIANLGRVVRRGMAATDTEIIHIMRAKQVRHCD